MKNSEKRNVFDARAIPHRPEGRCTPRNLMDVSKQITVDASLLEAVAKLPNLPTDLAAKIQHELSESANTDRELRRLYMRIDTIEGIPQKPEKWPEAMKQVSARFRNKTGVELLRAIAYSLEWTSGTTWVTRSARLALVDAADTAD